VEKAQSAFMLWVELEAVDAFLVLFLSLLNFNFLFLFFYFSLRNDEI
jgi:hypothetical protein